MIIKAVQFSWGKKRKKKKETDNRQITKRYAKFLTQSNVCVSTNVPLRPAVWLSDSEPQTKVVKLTFE